MTYEKPHISGIKLLEREPEPVLTGALLSPAQNRAYSGLIHALPIGNVFVLWGGVGKGKTTVLRAIHQKTRGAFLTLKDVIDSLQGRNPLAVEEAFEQLMMHA